MTRWEDLSKEERAENGQGAPFKLGELLKKALNNKRSLR